MVEVSYEFARSADVTVGSEEVEPPNGWPYQAILGKLVSIPSLTAEELATEVVSDYKSNYSGSQSTMSAIRTPGLIKVSASFKKLASVLSLSLPQTSSQIRRFYNNTQKFEYADYLDLIDLMTQFGQISDKGVAEAVNEVSDAMKSVVITNAANGPTVRKANGAAVYFPEPQLFDQSYRQLAFSQDTGWSDFLDRYKKYLFPAVAARLLMLATTPGNQLNIPEEIRKHEIDRAQAFIAEELKNTPKNELGARLDLIKSFTAGEVITLGIATNDSHANGSTSTAATGTTGLRGVFSTSLKEAGMLQ